MANSTVTCTITVSYRLDDESGGVDGDLSLLLGGLLDLRKQGLSVIVARQGPCDRCGGDFELIDDSEQAADGGIGDLCARCYAQDQLHYENPTIQ